MDGACVVFFQNTNGWGIMSGPEQYLSDNTAGGQVHDGLGHLEETCDVEGVESNGKRRERIAVGQSMRVG